MNVDYDWITEDMFYEKVENILNRLSGIELLAIPGIYAILCEELNNQVLEELTEDREDKS